MMLYCFTGRPWSEVKMRVKKQYPSVQLTAWMVSFADLPNLIIAHFRSSFSFSIIKSNRLIKLMFKKKSLLKISDIVIFLCSSGLLWDG
jgi:hypothetical protein